MPIYREALGMRTQRHMRADIAGILKLASGSWQDFRRQFTNVVTGDDGKILSPCEFHKELTERQSKGELFIPMGTCKGFDPQRGCPGHPIDERIEQAAPLLKLAEELGMIGAEYFETDHPAWAARLKNFRGEIEAMVEAMKREAME